MGEENWVGRVTPDWLQQLVNAPIPGAATARDWVDPPNTSVFSDESWLEQAARELFRSSVPQTARDAALEGAIGMVAGPVLGAGGRAVKRYLDVAPNVSRRAFFGDTVGGGDLQRRKQLQDAMFGTPDPPLHRSAVEAGTPGRTLSPREFEAQAESGPFWHDDYYLRDPAPMTPEQRALGNTQAWDIDRRAEEMIAAGKEPHVNMGVLGKQVRDWETINAGETPRDWIEGTTYKDAENVLDNALTKGVEAAKTLPKHTKNPILQLGEEGFNVFSERIVQELKKEGIEALSEGEGGEVAKAVVDFFTRVAKGKTPR